MSGWLRGWWDGEFLCRLITSCLISSTYCCIDVSIVGVCNAPQLWLLIVVILTRRADQLAQCLIFYGRINTCDMVQRNNPSMLLSPSWCILCKWNSENVDHIFFIAALLECCGLHYRRNLVSLGSYLDNARMCSVKYLLALRRTKGLL